MQLNKSTWTSVIRIILKRSYKLQNEDSKQKNLLTLVKQNRLAISTALLLFALAFFLRAWRLSSTPDIFGDEVLYASITISLPCCGKLMAFGAPWFVHPPLYYMMQSVFFQFAGINTINLSTIFTSRLTSVFYSSVTVSVVFLLGMKLTDYKTGAIAALVLTFEPYALKYSRIGLLESALVLFIVLALYMFYSASNEGSIKKFFLAGIFFGLSFLVKEVALFFLVTLAVSILLNHYVLKNRTNIKGIAVCIGTGVVMYMGYVAWAMSIDAPAFLNANYTLLERALWVIRNTGYTAANYPSFTSDLMGAANIYLMTYVLLALSAVSCVYLLYKYRDKTSVLLTSWMASSAIFFGGIGIHNPQFIVYLTVPAVVVSGGTLAMVAFKAPKPKFKWVSIMAALLLVLIICYNAYVWYQVDGVGTDNAVTQSINWIQANVPQGEKIWTSYTYQYFLPQNQIYDIGSLNSLQLIEGQNIHYFVYSPRWINLVDKSAMQYIQTGKLVAVFYGQSTQEIYIYYIANPI